MNLSFFILVTKILPPEQGSSRTLKIWNNGFIEKTITMYIRRKIVEICGEGDNVEYEIFNESYYLFIPRI